MQSSQDGSVSLQPLLQDSARRESIEAPDHHLKRCQFQPFASYLRVYVSEIQRKLLLINFVYKN